MTIQFAKVRQMTPALELYQAQAKRGEWENIAASDMNYYERVIACSWRWAAIAQYRAQMQKNRASIEEAIEGILDYGIRNATRRLLL